MEPGARARTDFGFACRTYATPDGPSGVPSLQAIAAAIRRGRTRTNFATE